MDVQIQLPSPPPSSCSISQLPEFLGTHPAATVYFGFASLGTLPPDEGDDPVAVVTTMLQYSTWSKEGAGSNVLNVHDLFVSGEARRKGLASSFIGEASCHLVTPSTRQPSPPSTSLQSF